MRSFLWLSGRFFEYQMLCEGVLTTGFLFFFVNFAPLRQVFTCFGRLGKLKPINVFNHRGHGGTQSFSGFSL